MELRPVLLYEVRYGLDGPSIECLLGRNFPHPPNLVLSPTQLHKQCVLGRGVIHPPPSSSEVKERVEIYHSSSSGPSCQVIGWTPTFAFTTKLSLFSYLSN